ncbi:hypothetical protein M8818_003894 [Zalaria obscura]|uniref:Uncharacterized protein n=1 Tax=Zalaria obscura TaxID=2024903 RepID=A0ACC3SCX9_9PEZI
MAVKLCKPARAFCRQRKVLPIRLYSTSKQPQPPRKQLHTDSHSHVSSDLDPWEGIQLQDSMEDDVGDLEHDRIRSPIRHEDLRKQLALRSPVDLVREALLHDFSQRYRNNQRRLDIQNTVFADPPSRDNETTQSTTPTHTQRTPSEYGVYQENLFLPRPASPHPFPVNGQPLSLQSFRENVQAALETDNGSRRVIRRIMREQLLRCQQPQDILRIVAVAMQNRETADQLTFLQHHIMRALYRIRNAVSDPKVLSTLNVIVKRLHASKLNVSPDLLTLGLKFSARARSLPGMKFYLRQMRDYDIPMTRNTFRATIAKFSIGSHGLGEIRNGRWRRSELLQVLLGFDDDNDNAYHFGAWLRRDDWQFLHGWVAVLARCKAVEELWAEWEFWRDGEERARPRRLKQRGREGITTRERGDAWFLEQMCHAGDVEKAWEIYKDAGLAFETLRTSTKEALLNGAEFATFWNQEIAEAMRNKYERDVKNMEAALGVKWVSIGEDGEGYHVTVDETELEAKLEALSDPDFSAQPDYGFPWEKDSAEQAEDRQLQEAEEIDEYEQQEQEPES